MEENGKSFRNKYLRFATVPHDDSLQLDLLLTFRGTRYRDGGSMGARRRLGPPAQQVLLFGLQDAGGHRFAGSPQQLQRRLIGIPVPVPVQVQVGLSRRLVGLVEGVAAAKGLQRRSLAAGHHVQDICGKGDSLVIQ